jgi:N utilization substance protein B
MLNRRILRVKVMQALYAFFQSSNTELSKGENELFHSIDRLYELYLFFLQLPVELADLADAQQTEAKNKALPTHEDLNPNRSFVENLVVDNLRGNEVFQATLKNRKISWAADRDDLKRLLKDLRSASFFVSYINENEKTFETDKKFILEFYKKIVIDSEMLYQLFNERSIYWDYDDVDFAISMATKHIKKLKASDNTSSIMGMYKDEEDDKNFIKTLYRKTIVDNNDNTALIEEKTKNWDVDRIAVMDVLCMKMAITELTQFSSIPIKVTLNEYIEISKLFSSPKSKVFINGILDKLVIDFKEAGKIKKTGRGLME